MTHLGCALIGVIAKGQNSELKLRDFLKNIFGFYRTVTKYVFVCLFVFVFLYMYLSNLQCLRLIV